MQNLPENVILFPKWRTVLEEESLQALKEKKYEDALLKLNKLLSYQIDSYEIISGKLICLMELGRHHEAQDICEELLKHKDEHYYHYLHIYLTILFQTNQYDTLMKQIDYEFQSNAVPSMMQEQFQQLYEMSSKMKADVSVEHTATYLDELHEAIEAEDYRKQWRLLEKLRKLRSDPTQEVISLLMKGSIHPVIKTAVFIWLQDINYKDKVKVHKWDTALNVKPDEVPNIHNQILFKQILLIIGELEQKDPSLYNLLLKLLNHYLYVRFPVLPGEEDAEWIAESLKYVGSSYLNIPSPTREESSIENRHYIEEIELCETLYESIIEES
ncbi:tetratricopeptide repeat protein [Virgibacillus salexigens]|uniref:Tetratricopeptide repeat protein n=1 Tax=Virgibacillus massiliensis TaxID=1462526 RepID=A0A024QB29_9BACI|nr:tetratricopeptide repeat protein [Virgibacillus massiliensis]CDQ39410.1 hypothetical protein BN990_01710 [Virgibacillus massiliensis]